MKTVLAIIGLALFLGACTYRQPCNELEQKLIDICRKTDTTYTVTLGSLTDFDWDILYVISGPTVDDEAGDIIGIAYEKVIPDNRNQYIFIKDGKIINEYSSSCSLNLMSPHFGTNHYTYAHTSQIQVRKRESDGRFVYRVKAF